MDMQDKKIDYRHVVLFFLIITSAMILLLLNQKSLFLKSEKQESLAIGLLAPDFTFPGLDGKMVNLSDYRGKVVLVNIWATWCTPCVDEMPSMEKLYQKLKGKDFEILAVSIDSLEAKAVVPFMNKHNLTFPVLFDSAETVKTSYRITGIPESFIIDKNGILIEKIIGSRDWARPRFQSFLTDLINRQ
jgi:cytochrome c biogenesis protein CcmG, thiol:disulfide interchange protein DsbE